MSSELDPDFLARMMAKAAERNGSYKLTARTAVGRDECLAIVEAAIAAGLLAHGPKVYVPNRIDGKRARFGY